MYDTLAYRQYTVSNLFIKKILKQLLHSVSTLEVCKPTYSVQKIYCRVIFYLFNKTEITKYVFERASRDQRDRAKLYIFMPALGI